MAHGVTLDVLLGVVRSYCLGDALSVARLADMVVMHTMAMLCVRRMS